MGNNQAGKSHEATDVLDGLCVAMAEEWAAVTPAQAVKPAARKQGKTAPAGL
jgi:hypothetical protein